MAKGKIINNGYEEVLYEEPFVQESSAAPPSAPGVSYTPVSAGASLYEKYFGDNPLGEKPAYTDSYGGKMAELYQKIAGRGPFRYDAANDPLYQGYKDQYIRGGKLAMKDTMGQAAALTGGYASSYGQSVGQQAYDAYLQSLGEVIPTLYGMAYDQYKDAGDQMLREYSMLGDLRDQEYGRYRDALGDWQNERSFGAQLEAEDYSRQQAADATNYSRQQDAYAQLYAAIAASGYVPSDAELQAAGMSRAAAEALAAEYQRGVDMDERNLSLRETSAANSGGGGSSGGGYSGRSGNGWYDLPDGTTVVGGSGSLADWWDERSAQGVSDAQLYQTLENVYADYNYGPEGDTFPVSNVSKAKKKIANKQAAKKLASK